MEDAIELLATDQQAHRQHKEIIAALNELVATLVSEHEDIGDHAIAALKKSVLDLEYFFKNTLEYSTDAQPSYLALELIHCSLPSSRRLESLEQLWVELNAARSSRSQHYVYLFTTASHISGKPKTTRAFFTSGSGPSMSAICSSATIGACCLIFHHIHGRSHCNISQISELISSIANSGKTHYVSPLGPIQANTTREGEARSIAFPEMPALRDLQPDFTLQMYEPHRKRPFTCASCTLWASLEPGLESICSAILYTGSVDLSNRIRSELMNNWRAESFRSIHAVTDFGDILWPQICDAGVHNMQQALRSTLERMDALKYENTAHPTTGFANVCQMILNHLEYCSRLTQALMRAIPTLSSSSDSGMASWTAGALKQCDIMEAEIRETLVEVKGMRKLVLEQYSLLQNSRANLLAVLATVFVPAGFVASFLSMNQANIETDTLDKFRDQYQTDLLEWANKGLGAGSSTNASSLNDTSATNNILEKIALLLGTQAKKDFPTATPGLFFSIAIPLIAATVLIPLTLVPITAFVARKATVPRTRYLVTWIWFGVALSLTFVSDMLAVAYVLKYPDIDPDHSTSRESFHYPNLTMPSQEVLDQIRTLKQVTFSFNIALLSFMSFSFLIHLIIFWMYRTYVKKKRTLVLSFALWSGWVIAFYFGWFSALSVRYGTPYYQTFDYTTETYKMRRNNRILLPPDYHYVLFYTPYLVLMSLYIGQRLWNRFRLRERLRF